MPIALPNSPKKNFAQRGEGIYNHAIHPQVEADNKGKVVAIDLETGEYELGENVLFASKALQARKPNAQIWVVRIGHRAVHRIGMALMQGHEWKVQSLDNGTVTLRRM